MREFKFRAWDKEFKVMLDGFSERSERFCIWSDGVVDECGVDKTNKWIVMQYTGLKDENGKEIFEGDIVIYTRYFKTINPKECSTEEKTLILEYSEEEIVYQLLYLSGCYFSRLGDIISEKYTLEVIGNIYENPKLLEHKE